MSGQLGLKHPSHVKVATASLIGTAMAPITIVSVYFATETRKKGEAWKRSSRLLWLEQTSEVSDG